MVTDLYKGGDLREELMNTGLYSEERAAELIKQVLDCLSYVHGEGIVHRDIKPGSKFCQSSPCAFVLTVFDSAYRVV